MRHTVLALALLASAVGSRAQAPIVPSERADPLLARLPADWQEQVRTLAVPPAQQSALAKASDEVLRQTLIRMLVRRPESDPFVKAKLRSDPSIRVRTTIVQLIGTDARWVTLPDTSSLLEHVASSDPEASVSIAALEALRRWKMRDLNRVLGQRLAAAYRAGATKAADLLAAEHDRWFSLERGVMLPTFLRDAPPLFTVAASDRTVRVLAFGDFGTGSDSQRQLAQTITAYHQRRPFDFAITLGDNFYSVGMESPQDPRWTTWFEDLYGSMGLTFYPSLGNHDWGHPDSPAAEILYSGKSRTWQMPASYYTYSAGPVQFFAIDTQSVAVSDKQLKWIDAEIGRSQAKWKIVYGHHPIYSGGNYEDRPDLIARLLPLLQHRVDAYVCGHDHNLQALRGEAGVRFYIAGGGGAGLYPLRPHERTLFASSTNGFAVLDASASELKVTFVDGAGKEIYSEVAKK